ncbi:TGS superfamily domain containing protein [Pandoravirus celtis]|uniref:TGS superfamily domain containing protein n=1 Tax=Pandoravirus celtis TaxID=2568002 RepID=A0A4D6EIU5_9VIRU|nr:TGS superfamily domain containing protein [Pandoravirus celtis]
MEAHIPHYETEAFGQWCAYCQRVHDDKQSQEPPEQIDVRSCCVCLEDRVRLARYGHGCRCTLPSVCEGCAPFTEHCPMCRQGRYERDTANICVIDLCGTHHMFYDISTRLPVHHIWYLLNRVTGLDLVQYRFIHEKRYARDGTKSLVEYGIRDGSVLYVVSAVHERMSINGRSGVPLGA